MFRNKEYVFQGWNGKAVLLFHGVTSGASQLRPLANYLNCMGYTVYGVNHAGHGTTESDLHNTTYQDLINKAEEDYQKIHSKYEKVFVSGLSLGGLTTLYLAARHPEIAGIIPMAAAVNILPGSMFDKEYTTEYMHRPTDGKTGMYKQYHVHYEYVSTKFLKEVKKYIQNFKEHNYINKIISPALIIHALDDSSVDPSSAKFIYDNISSTKKQLMLLETGEHVFVLNESRYEPFEKTAEFLARY
jgi:carboxylesterase